MSNKPSIFSGFFIYWSRAGAPARIALTALALSLISLPIALTASQQPQTSLRPQATTDETTNIQSCIEHGGAWDLAPEQCSNLCPDSISQTTCIPTETHTCLCPSNSCWDGDSCLLDTD